MSDLFTFTRKFSEAIVTAVTGGQWDNTEVGTYEECRAVLMARADLRHMVPEFVADNFTLQSLWGWIKPRHPKWDGRRTLVREAFAPLLRHLEAERAAPHDAITSATLKRFGVDAVHAAWQKALARRNEDPEGAITAARTLLETVCKCILEETGATVDDRDDLPQLYRKAAEQLNLAPTQHTEKVFMSILQSCMTVVKDLGEVRNKVGDAHGKGARPVRPAPRHAELAVNLAGSISAFLIETLAARQTKS